MVTDEAFLGGIGDFITALKLIDDTQVDIHDELVTLNEQLEGINDKLEAIAEYLDVRIQHHHGI